MLENQSAYIVFEAFAELLLAFEVLVRKDEHLSSRFHTLGQSVDTILRSFASRVCKVTLHVGVGQELKIGNPCSFNDCSRRAFWMIRIIYVHGLVYRLRQGTLVEISKLLSFSSLSHYA